MNKERNSRISNSSFCIGLILTLIALLSISYVESYIILFIFMLTGIIFFIISDLFFEKKETKYQKEIGFANNKIKPFVGEEILMEECPKEFQNSNKWTSLAMRIVETGFLDNLEDARNWNFRITDNFWKKVYISKLIAISNSKYLEEKDKISIISWKLSLILNEPPE